MCGADVLWCGVMWYGVLCTGTVTSTAGSVNVTGSGVVTSDVDFNAAGVLSVSGSALYQGTVTAISGVAVALTASSGATINETTVFSTPIGVVSNAGGGGVVQFVVRRPVTAVVNGGAWDVDATWSPAIAPTAGADVQIGAGITVTAPAADAAARFLILESGGRLDFGARRLSLADGLQVSSGNTGFIAGLIDLSGALSVAGTLVVDTTGSVLTAGAGGSIAALNGTASSTVQLSAGTFTLSNVKFGDATRIGTHKRRTARPAHCTAPTALLCAERTCDCLMGCGVLCCAVCSLSAQPFRGLSLCQSSAPL
jgi:hypothetical protein